jgi:uncharacterized protein
MGKKAHVRRWPGTWNQDRLTDDPEDAAARKTKNPALRRGPVLKESWGILFLLSGVRLLVDHGLDHMAGTDATGAGLDGLDLPVGQLGAHGLQVGHETPTALVVRMADVVTGGRTLSAYIAKLGHVEPPRVLHEKFVAYCSVSGVFCRRQTRRTHYLSSLFIKGKRFFLDMAKISQYRYAACEESMKNWKITVNDLPAEGRDFSFTDPEFWAERLVAHHVDAKPVQEVQTEISVQPQSGGALVRGTLRGSVQLRCDRCAERFEIPVQASIELFETLPKEGEPEEDSRLQLVDDALVLDLGSLLWEEFVLSLPVKPLCNEQCKGICPKCGQNFNEGSCDCARDEGDPRLAVFRDLKLK